MGVESGKVGEMTGRGIWLWAWVVRWMETVRSSTAGDALLMESALHVVIQQARDGPSARSMLVWEAKRGECDSAAAARAVRCCSRR
jgi:hypothetical protein